MGGMQRDRRAGGRGCVSHGDNSVMDAVSSISAALSARAHGQVRWQGQTPTPKGRTTWAGETHRGPGVPYSVVQLGTGDGSPPSRAGGGGAGLEECQGPGGGVAFECQPMCFAWSTVAYNGAGHWACLPWCEEP